MTQEQSKLICPKCGEEIDVNDVLYHQVDEQLKKKYSDELAKEKEKYNTQASKLEEDRKTLEAEKTQQQEEVAKRVNDEVKQIEAALKKAATTRRDFLKAATGVAGALGVLAFPPGVTQVIDSVSAGVSRITQTYPRLRIASIADLVKGQPLDFQYPLEEHNNLLVKLGTPALLGIGSDGDIVAFSYSCAHMGCPLNGMYKSEHNVLGPCPCHFSQFDLSKNGTLVIGQATQSLPQVVLEVEDGGVFATGVTGLLYGHWNNLAGRSPIVQG